MSAHNICGVSSVETCHLSVRTFFFGSLSKCHSDALGESCVFLCRLSLLLREYILYKLLHNYLFTRLFWFLFLFHMLKKHLLRMSSIQQHGTSFSPTHFLFKILHFSWCANGWLFDSSMHNAAGVLAQNWRLSVLKYCLNASSDCICWSCISWCIPLCPLFSWRVCDVEDIQFKH